MHQKMADIALFFLRISIAYGRYPFCFQAARRAASMKLIVNNHASETT